MCQAVFMATPSSTRPASGGGHIGEAESPASTSRESAIHAAAIEQFSARGFSGTSMANIAEAAGMSRPALYQYFRNKADIFASAFAALLDGSVDRALAALDGSGPTVERLDGFLQRFDGDLWEQMSASPHSDEILNAKVDLAMDDVAASIERLWVGMERHLEQVGAGAGAGDPAERRAAWCEMLHLAPKGFKSDQPSVEVYRRRLTTLAQSVAADIGS